MLDLKDHRKIESYLSEHFVEPVKGMKQYKFLRFDSLIKKIGTTDLNKICKTKFYKKAESKGSILGFLEKRRYNSEDWDYHIGLDILRKSGTPVHCVDDGKVVFAKRYSNRILFLFKRKRISFGEHPDQWGNRVILEHRYKINRKNILVYAQYAHLKELPKFMRKEKVIKKGQRIGEIGEPFSWENGGWPAHLHFQVTLDRQILESGYSSNPKKVLKKLINPEKIFFHKKIKAR